MRNSILKHKLGAVIVAALISIIILTFIFIFRDELKEFGTLLTLIASAPVAFVIWVIRDENVTQQIENTRKDTNLREFQKLAEWISGAHLIEDKVIEKSINQNGDIETIREYTDISKELSIPTFSKKDGAVGLQISAIYNLLPFYRGEHGESFKKPALNLLTSAWLSLQQKELEKLEKGNLVDNIDDYKKIIFKIQKNAKSPLGIAITRVLLSLNSKQELCLLEHKEVFPNLVLAGMDFHLSGLDKKVLNLFQTGADYSGINLIGAELLFAELQSANLREANLQGAKLQGAKLQGAYLQGTYLTEANLQRANLTGTDLTGAKLQWANLQKANLLKADLTEAKLQRAYLQGAYLHEANLQDANLQDANLLGANFRAYFRTNREIVIEGANLENTDFTDAEFIETVDFSGAKNIDKAIGLPPEIVEKYKAKTEN